MAYDGEVILETRDPFSKSMSLLESLEPGRVVAVDTESNGFSVRLGARLTVVSLAWRDSVGVGHGLALPFGQGQGRDKTWASVAAWEMIMEKLSQSNLVLFNAFFDHGMLQAGSDRDGGLDLGHRVHWDSMIAEKAILSGSTGGLKPTAERYGLTGGNEREDEGVIMRWLALRGLNKGDMHKVPWGVMQPYSRTDAILTLRLFEAQTARLLELPIDVQAKVASKMSALREKLTGVSMNELIVA